MDVGWVLGIKRRIGLADNLLNLGHKTDLLRFKTPIDLFQNITRPVSLFQSTYC